MLLTDPVTSITPPSKPEVPKRLLVVDDSEMNRKMVTRLMNSLGYSCDEAEDGCVAHQKVVEALQKGVSYEFVLMDNGEYDDYCTLFVACAYVYSRME
jgi:PleD family two-component response regulator